MRPTLPEQQRASRDVRALEKSEAAKGFLLEMNRELKLIDLFLFSPTKIMFPPAWLNEFSEFSSTRNSKRLSRLI